MRKKKEEEVIINPDVDIIMNTSCAVDMEKTYNSIVDYYHDAIKNRNKNIKLTFTVGKLSRADYEKLKTMILERDNLLFHIADSQLRDYTTNKLLAEMYVWS